MKKWRESIDEINMPNIHQKTHESFNYYDVKNANHSLDIGEFETTNSLFALSRVMEKLQEVIRGV